MVSWFIVPGCKNSGGVKKNLHFYSFPKCDEIRTLWIEIINKTDWMPSPYSKVCSDHFNEDDYLSKRKLRSDAVPRLFPASKIQRVSETQHDVHTTVSAPLADDPIILDPTSNRVVLVSRSQTPELIIPDHNYIICPHTIETNSHSQRIVVQQPNKNESILIKKLAKSRSVETNTLPMPKSMYTEAQRNEKEMQMKLKIRTLQRSVQRKNRKLQELTDLLEQTKAQIPDTKKDMNHFIQDNFSGFMKELVTQEISFADTGKTGRKYSANVKEFATALYSISPKAYNFVTNFINLPNSRSIRLWLADANCGSSSSLQSEN